MTRRVKRTIGVAAAAAVVGVGSFIGVAAATGGEDQPLTGTARDRAVAAALAHIGGGAVLEAAAGDDGAAYEVEVRRPDGSVVEVHLDRALKVSGTERDDPGDREEAGGGGS
jgi:hypothetical protein